MKKKDKPFLCKIKHSWIYQHTFCEERRICFRCKEKQYISKGKWYTVDSFIF